MSTRPRGIRFLVPACILLFVGLALLTVFFITGESDRARILVEYEADRVAASLVDTYRSQGSIDPAGLDQRILGFGIYRAEGSIVAGFGTAPSFLQIPERAPAFRYDEHLQTLALKRPLGMGGPRLERERGRWGTFDFRNRPRGTEGSRGRNAGSSGMFFLSLDIGEFYQARKLYAAATVIAPLLIAGLAAALLALIASNLRYRRRAEEQQTLARLGESARTLAHEIRNPLGAIRIQTGLLRKKMPEGITRELDVIEEETERLNVLSRRVGDFLKSPAGTLQQIECAEFLRDLSRRSSYAVHMDADLPHCLVSFDRDLLRSVIENLVRNAHESYGNMSSENAVEIALSREGGRITIAVRDKGKGIPGELLKKVFDPFYTDKIHGSGIGLPLARRFVEAAGGTLTLAPRTGGGTEARVVLPAGGAS